MSFMALLTAATVAFAGAGGAILTHCRAAGVAHTDDKEDCDDDRFRDLRKVDYDGADKTAIV